MAKSLEQLIGEQKSGVRPLSELQAEASAEVEHGVRDELLGRWMMVPLPDAARQRIPMGLFDEGDDPEPFRMPGDPRSDMVWGQVKGRTWERDDAGRLKAYYQLELGFSPEMVEAHTDAITEALFGEPLEYKSAVDRIKDNYRNGQITVQLADLGLAVLAGRDTAATWQEIDRLRKLRSGDWLAKSRAWWEKMLSSTAEMLPMIGETVEAAPAGALTGGIAGLAAGVSVSAASPTIGEEALIPALAFSGVKLGAGVAGAVRMGQIEAGLGLLDMLDAGIDPAIAKAAAYGIGAVNGAIELVQISTLFNMLPGGRAVGQRVVNATVRRLIKQGTYRQLAAAHSLKFGAYLGAETLQELAQESVNVTAEEVSKALMAELGLGGPPPELADWGDPDYYKQLGKAMGAPIQPAYATVEQIKERMLEVGAKSLQSFTVLGIPGSALSVAVDAAAVHRNPVEALLPDGRDTQVQVQATEVIDDQTAEGRVSRTEREGKEPGRAVQEQGEGRASPADGGVLQAQGQVKAVEQARAEAARGVAAAQPQVPAAGQIVPPAPRGAAQQATPAAAERSAIEAALGELSYEALSEKARAIGIAIKGKKAQLAALIADAIKAKIGTVRRTAGDRRQLSATEDAIRQHPAYQAALEGVENVTFRPTGATLFYIPKDYASEISGYAGERFGKGANRAMWNMITHDPKAGQHWDDAASELGWPDDLDGFLQRLQAVVAGERQLAGGFSEQALARALGSQDPYLLMLDAKRQMLRDRRSAFDINNAIEEIGGQFGVDRTLYEDLLLGEGRLYDPDDPHPGSMTFREFMDRLGRELADAGSQWVRQWSIPDVAETPKAWWTRLKAEWDALAAQEVAADLNLGQVMAPGQAITAEQEAQIAAIDAEQTAEEILEREKMTMFADLLDAALSDGAELGRLRSALRQAYRAGADEGIARAREAYRAMRQRIKARADLREHVAQLLRIIKRPVGKSVAIVQRMAIEMIQAEIDPQFRSKRTMAERQAAREFFAAHPEAQAPAKVLATVQAKSPGELTVAQIEEVARSVIELRRKGKILQRRAEEARQDRRAEDVRKIVAAVTGGAGLDFEGGGPIVAAPKETPRQRWWAHYVNSLTPERVFDWLDRGRDFLGPIFSIFWTRVADAESAKRAMMAERQRAMEAALKDLGLTAAELDAVALDIHGEPITVQQAIGIYNFLLNYASQLAVTFGNRISLADQRRVREYVEGRPEIKALADWILDHYEQHYDRLREAVIRADNRDMGKEINYTPMRRMELDYTPDDRQVLTEMLTRHHFKRGYAEKGMTLMRKDIHPEHQKPIRIDAWTLLAEQVERQEHYIAFASLVKELHALLRDESVADAVGRRGGRQMMEWLRHYVDAVGNPNIYRTYGDAEKLARRARRNTALAFLAYKLTTILKQPVSMVRYLPHAGLHLLQAGMEAATDWQRVRELVVRLDPLLERPPIERELEEMRLRNAEGFARLRDQIGEVGMQGIIWMDGVARTIGWYGTYLHEMAAHGDQGRAVAKARLATSLTQAGARVFQLPEMYRTSQEYLLLLTQFTNELNKLWNITTYDLPQLVRNRHYARAAQTFIALGLEMTLMWMIANRRLPEDDGDALEIFGEQGIVAIPVLGPMIPALWQGFGSSGVPVFEGAAEAVVAGGRLLEDLAEGDADEETILKAAHQVYRGLAPVVGLPYTGPRDVIRTLYNWDLAYLLGTPPKEEPKTKAGRRAAVKRRRR